MWVAITLTIIVCAVITCGILIALPMCKDYDELHSEEKKNDVVCAASSEPTEDNGGDSALNIDNIESKE